MTHILHIFKKQANIPKPHYTVAMRKEFAKWPKSIHSEIGYKDGNRLVLSENYSASINSNPIGAIIMQDCVPFDDQQPELCTISLSGNKKVTKENSDLFAFNIQNNCWSFELFTIEKTASGTLELHLKYEENKFGIGAPKRENQKLFELEIGTPIEVKIIGKSDATMAAGKQRTYFEFDSIIEYWGEVNAVVFEAPNRTRVERAIPQVIEKTIDLRKILY